MYCSSDSASRAAVEQTLRHSAPQEESDDPFTENYSDEEKVSEEDRRRERHEKGQLRQIEKAERSRLYQAIIGAGGIRMRGDLREEYRSIPNVYKCTDGFPGDEIAEHLSVHHPEFGIKNERDLIDALVALRTRSRRA